ncbi:MAG: AtpZ/AtpI family protein [Thermodesulfobacteriota bacterium]|nr:AtpZ/AtpI family protein [Thermodesulfobacteriota bacterium]
MNLKQADRKRPKWVDQKGPITLMMQVGLTMAGSILFCFAIGYYLDKWLNTKGIFITIFILLGIIGGGYKVYLEIMEASRFENNDKTQDE